MRCRVDDAFCFGGGRPQARGPDAGALGREVAQFTCSAFLKNFVFCATASPLRIQFSPTGQPINGSVDKH